MQSAHRIWLGKHEECGDHNAVGSCRGGEDRELGGWEAHPRVTGGKLLRRGDSLSSVFRVRGGAGKRLTQMCCDNVACCE